MAKRNAPALTARRADALIKGMPLTVENCRIRLFRFVQDAWEDGMRDWLRARAAVCLRGGRAWVVVADLAQAAWLRRRAVEEDISLLGIKFLTAGALRRELASLLGEESRLLGRESLEFLLKLSALEHAGAEARSVALDPAQCLQALDDLGRAGWSGAEADLGEVPSPARDWLRVLAASGAWAPATDRKLLAKSRKLSHSGAKFHPENFPALHLCFWAWDRELGAERTLLAAALAAARESVFFLPAPLEDLEFNWLSELQGWCGAEPEVCAASDFSSANEELTEHLFRRGESLAVTRPPAVLVGATEDDELALLERAVWRALETGGAGGPVGVVFPRRDTLSRRLTRRLLEAGAPVFDHVGDAAPADWSAELQQRLAAYYLYGCQADDFLALAVTWQLGGGPAEPERWRRRLREAFRRRQTRHAPALLDGADDEAGGLARALGAWPAREEWLALKARWQRAVRRLGGATDGLEPLWSRLDPVLAGRPVAGRAFLEYVGGLLKPARITREGADVFAKIEIVTPRQAAGRVWGHLIFAESNEGSWPLAVTENPFLTDAARAALNRRRGSGRGWLFTTGERAALESKRLRDTLDNCAGTTTFTAAASDAASPDRPLYPNGLLSQLLALSGGGSAQDAWRKSIVRVSAAAAGADSEPLADAERARLAVIAQNRRDPQRAFDEYSFCYPAEFAAGLRWSVTKLESVGDAPATAALALLFNAEAADDEEDFTRNASWFAGTLTHEWIKRCLADGAPPLALKAARLAEAGAALRRELSVSGLWLETAFRAARWMTDELLAAAYAAGLAESPLAEVERDIAGVVPTAAGPLALKGRLDLVLTDSGHWRVFDFKTGKADAPTAAELARGEGLQFGAYLLLALAAGAKSAEVQCLSPRRSESRTLALSEAGAAEQGLARAALAQRTLCFGIGVKRRRNEWCERLPLAFTPIEPAVLAEKARLTFGLAAAADGEPDEL